MKLFTVHIFFFSAIYIETPHPCAGYNLHDPPAGYAMLNKVATNMAHDLIRDAFRKLDTVFIYKKRYRDHYQFFIAELVFSARARIAKMMTIFMRSYDNLERLTIESHIKSLDDLTGLAIEANHISEMMQKYHNYLKTNKGNPRRDLQMREDLEKDMKENVLRDKKKAAQARKEGKTPDIKGLFESTPLESPPIIGKNGFTPLNK